MIRILTERMLVPVMSAMALAAVAPLQTTDPQLELVEIRVHARAFERFCERLRVDDEQRSCAAACYEIYRSALAALDHRLEQKLYDELNVATGGEAARVLRGLRTDDAAGMVAWIHDLRRSTRAESNLLQSTLLEEIAALLHPSQIELWNEALLALRRNVLLNPGIDPCGPNRRIDLGVAVDLNDLLEEAKEAGHELSALSAEDALSEPWQTIDDKIRGLMGEHNSILDAMLAGRATALLDGKQEMREALMQGDPARVKRIHETLVRRRLAVMRLNYRTAQRLSYGLRETIDDDVSARWMLRVDRAHFPETFRVESPDLMNEWLNSQSPLNDDVKERVSIIYSNFARSREILRQDAKALVMELNEDRPAYFRHEPHPAEGRLRKIDERRSELAADTLARFRTHLTPDVREQFDEALSRFIRDGVEGEDIRF